MLQIHIRYSVSAVSLANLQTSNGFLNLGGVGSKKCVCESVGVRWQRLADHLKSFQLRQFVYRLKLSSILSARASAFSESERAIVARVTRGYGVGNSITYLIIFHSD